MQSILFRIGSSFAIPRLKGTPEDDFYPGTDGDDFYEGLGGNDTILGADGADALYGNNGNDHLIGEYGNDVLNGGRGDDTLEGREGNDILIGGGGNDLIIFGDMYKRDTCRDFQTRGPGRDTVDISGLSGIDSFEDLKEDHMVRKGRDVIITGDGGDRLTFLDMKISQFNVDVFIFDAS
jgi:Ca2+-binding RTX toxin-like protein